MINIEKWNMLYHHVGYKNAAKSQIWKQPI